MLTKPTPQEAKSRSGFVTSGVTLLADEQDKRPQDDRRE
jgi:hypothetical protein